jgi:hypothetical protein
MALPTGTMIWHALPDESSPRGTNSAAADEPKRMSARPCIRQTQFYGNDTETTRVHHIGLPK